jgi:hypothetical protein
MSGFLFSVMVFLAVDVNEARGSGFEGIKDSGRMESLVD